MIKQRFRKWLSITLSVGLVAGFCLGCNTTAQTGQQTTSPTSTAKATDTQTGTNQTQSEYVIQILTGPKQVVKRSDETPVGKVIKDKFNVVFEYLPLTGDAIEKETLMLSTGDYPEVTRLENNLMYSKYVEAGAAICLDDYIADSTNFSEVFKEQLPYWRLSTTDGKIYKWERSVPQDIDVAGDYLDIGVRTDALEAQGWPNLVSEDDWFNFLKQALVDFPETNGQPTIGITFPMGESWGPSLTTEFIEKGGITNDQATNDAVLWNQVDQCWEAAWTNRDFIQNLRWFNRLYLNGLLDKECFTDTSQQSTEKGNNAQAIAFWYIYGFGTGANAQLIAAGHPEMQYIHQPIRSNDQVKAGLKRQSRLETTRPFDTYVITKNCKDPARFFSLLDWSLSEEGQILLQSGIEGQHYLINDKGEREPTEEFTKGIMSDPEYTETAGLNSGDVLGLTQSQDSKGISYDLQKEIKYKDQLFLTDRQKEALKKLGWESSMDYWKKTSVAAPTGLAGTCSLDPNSDISKLNEKFISWRASAGTKLITATDFDATLAELNTEYEKMDIQKVVDEYNRILNVNKQNLAKYLP
ncbi:MAG: hypothetical protein VB070_11165 [Clostridiaceae bacterium]|nr:hypothetical protein [Clostridiaceae bacterium]